MAERERDSVLLTVAMVLLLVVVIGAVATLARDEGAPAPETGDDVTVPSVSLSVPTGTPGTTRTPADRATPTKVPDSEPTSPPEPTSTACVSTDERTRLTVLTFNIHSARAADGSVHLDTIASELGRWDADVVLLQEVDRGREWTGRADMPAVLAKALGSSWTFGANVRRSPTNEYGTAILSRFPIVDSSNVALPAPPGTQQRGLLHATIDVDGTRLSVYNTHLESSSPIARTRQMQTILPLLRADSRPMILGGDLNAVPTADVLRAARTVVADSWRAAGSGTGLTAPAGSPRHRIDYLLHAGSDRADLVPLRTQVLVSAVSDHRAVHATYEMTSRNGEVCVPVLEEGDLP